MKKKVLGVLLCSSTFFAALSLTSCSPKSYDMSNVSFDNLEVVYDGSAHSLAIEGTLPEGVTVTYSGNEQVNVGTYTVTASFKGSSKMNPIEDMVATLKIVKADYDISGITFTDKTVAYTGSNQTLEVAGTLPEGVSVNYTLNGEAFTGATNVGTYEVVANFSSTNANYNAIPSKTATLKIASADYDVSGITFTDKTVTYTGSNQTLEVAGTLPEGVSVNYTLNGEAFTGATNVGTYEVVANFSSTNANYNAIPSKTATLTIEKATYDLSGVTFTDKTVTYTGANQTLEVAGTLPEGVSVNYTVNGEAFTGAVNAGTYEVVANFTGSNPNYNAIPSKTATLTIEKATYDLSGITFADKTVTYTGENQTLEVVGTLPEGVSVNYTLNGEAFTGAVNAGTYEVVANFTGANPNYNAIPSKTATLTIKKATFDVSEFDFEQHVVFDGKEHTYVISKDILDKLPEGVTASVVEKDAFVDCNEYLFTIKFSVEGNYNAIASVDATLFIDKADYDLSQFVLEDQSSHYTGKNLVASYSGKILDVNGEEVKVDVQFSYKQNGELVSPVNVGEYDVLAEFVVSDNNYNAIDNKLFTLTVLKGEIDWIVLNDVMLQYTDDHKSISTKGDLPEGVSVNYFIDETPINDVTTLEIGEHLITAKLVLNEEAAKSWNQPDDLKANLTITKKVIVPEFVCEYTYDGEPHNVVVQGIDGIFTATFENNDFVTEMGTKEVIVKFDGDFNHYSIGIEGVDEAKSITVELVINQKIIEINDIAGLIDFMNNWQTNNTYSVKFVLTNDIDFNDPNKEESVTYWESVGTWGSPFQSNFDGQGHTISNLLMTFESNIVDVATEKWIGFFGAIGQYGVVENLKIDNASINFDASASGLAATETGILAGAIAGTARNIEITNSTIDIITTKAEAGVLTGRLAGTVGVPDFVQDGPKTTIENILIKDTSMTVKVATGRIAGGVISGRMYNSGMTIKDIRMENVSLVADGNNISSASNLGVIVGYFKKSGTENIINIVNVKADVTITTKSNTKVYVGGGAGYFEGPINFITTNYNVNLRVILNNPSSSYVGGFVGYSNYPSKGESLSKLIDSSLSTTIEVSSGSEAYNDNFGKLMGYGSETEISSDTSNTTATLVFNCANESYSPTINEIGKGKLAA